MLKYDSKILKSCTALFFAILLFVGCTATQQKYAQQSAMVAVEAEVLKKEYARVEKLIRIAQDEKEMFSDEEWRSLLNVDASLDMMIAKYEAMIHLNTTLNMQEIKFMWRLAVESYRQGREVIYNHWEEFRPSTQILLNGFDHQATLTSDRITELMEDPTNENINTILTLISNIATIGVKMLGVAVL